MRQVSPGTHGSFTPASHAAFLSGVASGQQKAAGAPLQAKPHLIKSSTGLALCTGRHQQTLHHVTLTGCCSLRASVFVPDRQHSAICQMCRWSLSSNKCIECEIAGRQVTENQEQHHSGLLQAAFAKKGLLAGRGNCLGPRYPAASPVCGARSVEMLEAVQAPTTASNLLLSLQRVQLCPSSAAIRF